MTPALEVKDLGYTYPDGRRALTGVTFVASPGERIGVIGPNGAGKSTLLLHLNGVLPDRPARAPAVSVGGLPATVENLRAIRRRVGVLFQDPDDQLFCPTVYDDVAFGPLQFGLPDVEVRAIVRKALATVGLEGCESRSPHHLSGGEKQRVCLAGVLACAPDVLVLDEPTSDLDPRGRRELRGVLRSLEVTMLIATHDLEMVVDLCPRTILLDGGSVVADGPTIPLLSDQNLMLAHGLERPHILTHHHPHA